MAGERLDRARIVRTALDLLNDVGLDGVSMRRLADELGVQAPALYRHFAAKQDLLRGMADAMFDPQPAVLDRPAPGADWADWLTARAHALRTAMLSYRDGGRLKEHLPGPSGHWPGMELLLQMMEEAGFTGDDALRGVFTIDNHVLGSVIAEQETQTSPETVEIDPVRFPRLARGATLRRDGRDFTREFDFGLGVIVTGLRSTLDTQRPRPRATRRRTTRA